MRGEGELIFSSFFHLLPHPSFVHPSRLYLFLPLLLSLFSSLDCLRNLHRNAGIPSREVRGPPWIATRSSIVILRSGIQRVPPFHEAASRIKKRSVALQAVWFTERNEKQTRCRSGRVGRHKNRIRIEKKKIRYITNAQYNATIIHAYTVYKDIIKPCLLKKC